MAPTLTLRAKIAHLYRRLGLGATPQELDAGEKLGLEGTIKRLVDFPLTPDLVSPYEFVWREKEDPDIGSWRFRTWWIHNMLTTEHPLQEKLAVFWHSHFAVSDTKVEDGLMMLGYLQALRKHGTGHFPTLLKAVSKEPAMMKYLDMERALRGRPNENFAREVLELFTLGIGNYTEADVKETSRALTGWGYLNTFWEMPGSTEQKMKDALADSRPFSAFLSMPAMRDDRPKTVLGKTADFDGDGVLDHLASQHQTARFIVTKLWEFFAYPKPEVSVVDRLANVFFRSKGDIRKTMFALVRSPEFWSERAIRTMPKSPLDLCIGVARQQGIGEAMRAMRPKEADFRKMIPKRILDESGNLAYRMDRMGLTLLCPPDVSGWKWGEAWITPAGMAERYQFTGAMFWGEKGPDEGALNPLAFVKSKAPKDSLEIARALCELFDVELPDTSLPLIAKVFDVSGGVKSLEDKGNWTGRMTEAMKLIVAAPEMHLC